MNQSGTQQQSAGTQQQNTGAQRQSGSQGFERSINMAEIALRGSSTLMDIQLATLRNVAQMQARSAALFGLPDCSELFNATDKLIQCQLSAATDQWLSSTRQISQACAETQKQFGRAIQKGTTQLAQEIRKSVEEIGQRTRQGMQEFTDMAERQASETEQGFGAMGHAGETQHRSGNGQGQDHNQGQSESGNMNMAQEETQRKGAQPRKTQ